MELVTKCNHALRHKGAHMDMLAKTLKGVDHAAPEGPTSRSSHGSVGFSGYEGFINKFDRPPSPKVLTPWRDASVSEEIKFESMRHHSKKCNARLRVRLGKLMGRGGGERRNTKRMGGQRN